MNPDATTQSNPLCDYCMTLFFRGNFPEYRQEGEFTKFYVALEAAAQMGCYICGKIRNSFAWWPDPGDLDVFTIPYEIAVLPIAPESPIQAINGSDTASSSSGESSSTNPDHTSNASKEGSSAPLASEEDFISAEDHNFKIRFDEIDPYIYVQSIRGITSSRPYLANNTGSQESMRLASKWSRDCKERHQLCQPRDAAFISRSVPSDEGEGGEDCSTMSSSSSLGHHASEEQLTGPMETSWYPSRSIDVGDACTIKIVETKGRDVSGPYMTLSHCWGNTVPARLTTDSRDYSERGFTTGYLPETFREAVLVAKQSNVRYLWIDSLCIVQDSLDDWRQESATMHQVYSHSCCNIAACDSSDSNGGLFRPRSQRDLHIVRSEWEDRANSLYTLPKNLAAEAGENRLLERGWCVQESLLSRRTLHYGKRRSWWTCREFTACEIYPWGVPIGVERDVRSALGQPRHKLHSFFNPNSHVGSWMEIVWAYSCCNSTKEKDKLVASSGLANEMRAATGDVYRAGSWESQPLSQLMWTTPGSYASRPNQYRAPSWSWASLEGEIRFDPRPSGAPSAQVSEVHVETVGEDPTGEVSSAFLVLDANVFRFDALLPVFEEWEDLRTSYVSGDVGNLFFDVEPTEEDKRKWSSWVFVPLLESRGLILQPVPGKGRRYRRVGLVFILWVVGRRVFEEWWSENRKPELAETPSSQRQSIHII